MTRHVSGVAAQQRETAESTGRRRRKCANNPVAGESLHPNAGIHQVNLEWRRGYCSGSVATECFRVVSLAFRYPRREWMMCGEAG
jgi:hypothetical protein